MNQILATHNNANNNKKPIDTNRIIAFFCIAIIAFGIFVISIAGYRLYKSITQDKRVQKLNNPEVSVEQLEDSIKISAKYEEGINSIIYTWNDEEAYEINLNGTTTIEKLIDLIDKEGENTLKVEVVGLDGRRNSTTKTFELEGQSGGESTNPVIQWVIKSNDNKITVIATDETELKHIKYQWDSENAITIERFIQTPNKIETDIEIKRGQHKLIITAEDKDGNISTKSGTFKGVKKPEINAIKYGNVVEITVSHDMGFKKVEFIINDEIYVYDQTYSGYSESNKSLLYKANLKEGENVIQVTAESLEQARPETSEGTITVYKGRCEYDLNTNE